MMMKTTTAAPAPESSDEEASDYEERLASPRRRSARRPRRPSPRRRRRRSAISGEARGTEARGAAAPRPRSSPSRRRRRAEGAREALGAPGRGARDGAVRLGAARDNQLALAAGDNLEVWPTNESWWFARNARTGERAGDQRSREGRALARERTTTRRGAAPVPRRAPPAPKVKAEPTPAPAPAPKKRKVHPGHVVRRGRGGRRPHRSGARGGFGHGPRGGREEGRDVFVCRPAAAPTRTGRTRTSRAAAPAGHDTWRD